MKLNRKEKSKRHQTFSGVNCYAFTNFALNKQQWWSWTALSKHWYYLFFVFHGFIVLKAQLLFFFFSFFFFSDLTTIYLFIYFIELYSSKIFTAAMKAIQTRPKLSENGFAIWVAHSQGFKFQKNVSLPSLLHRLGKWVNDCEHTGFWVPKMWFWLCNMREPEWSRTKNHR